MYIVCIFEVASVCYQNVLSVELWKDCFQSLCISFVLELDRMLGDTMVEIVDYESRILLKLVQFIQERIAPLHKLIKLASELDW